MCRLPHFVTSLGQDGENFFSFHFFYFSFSFKKNVTKVSL